MKITSEDLGGAALKSVETVDKSAPILDAEMKVDLTKKVVTRVDLVRRCSHVTKWIQGATALEQKRREGTHKAPQYQCGYAVDCVC